MSEGNFNLPKLGGHEKEKTEQQKRAEATLIEKFAVVRMGVLQYLKNSDNPVAISEFMYQVVYHPESIEDVIEKLAIKDSEMFPNRTAHLKEKVSFNLENVPSEETFIQEITRAITKEADFENCLAPGVEEQLETMVDMGLVRIWTAGDNEGALSPEGQSYPGVHGQLKKLARTGIFSEIKNNALKDLDPAERIRKRRDLLTVKTAEDKFELVPAMIEEFEEKGIRAVFIVEDNLAYLMRAEKAFKDAGFEVNPIWVRHGKNKKKIPKESGHDLEYYIKEYSGIDEVSGIKEILEKYQSESDQKETGFVVDFDDVIMDSDLKLAAQGKAMVEKMKEKKWI